MDLKFVVIYFNKQNINKNMLRKFIVKNNFKRSVQTSPVTNEDSQLRQTRELIKYRPSNIPIFQLPIF